ncbi:hypothetical protein CMV_007157 [Castanea mollissima]|uniref:Uncharacterized protein n=1 Tax=Castanea mollissima TaxID=60419 RepID=A0A8J4RU61_9ROSI|nr:hypothetical protein CMV_007157 [Castanea mollissima]
MFYQNSVPFRFFSKTVSLFEEDLLAATNFSFKTQESTEFEEEIVSPETKFQRFRVFGSEAENDDVYGGHTHREALGLVPAMPRELDLELLCLVTVSWKGQRKQRERERERVGEHCKSEGKWGQ